MKSPVSFVITEFPNPSGGIVFRVSGYLKGERIRKNFRTREEAILEKDALELNALQAKTGIRSAATRLTDDQLKEAEAGFSRLKDKPRSLLFYLDYALAHYREPEQQRPLTDAIADYEAMKSKELERTLLSPRQLGSIKGELAILVRYFPKGSVAQFTPDNLLAYLERGKPTLKTYNNRRGILSTFFKFAFQKGWVPANPIERTPHHRINHRRGSAVTINVEKAAEMMAFVETFEKGALVPYFAICLFAGIRPCIRYGEITKLQPASVKLETNTIHVEPEVSKVRMKRLVTIQPNLAAWLRAYPLDRYAIVPKNSMNTRRIVFAKFKLTHDVLRHTFISMFVAKFRSMGEAALQAGNSESIIRKHYLDLKSPTEAEQFFAIMPSKVPTVMPAPRMPPSVAA